MDSRSKFYASKLDYSAFRFKSVKLVDYELQYTRNDDRPIQLASFENPTLIRGWIGAIYAGAVVLRGETIVEFGDIRHSFSQLQSHELANAEMLASLGTSAPHSRADYSVAVCTADKPENLQRCLRSLQNIGRDTSEIIIVDNSRHRFREVENIVDQFGFRYVREPLPGLDRARNRALAEATTQLVLFTDDDVEISPNWDIWLRDAFTDPLVMAAGGLVLATELESQWQLACEIFSCHSRGGRHKRLGNGANPSAGGVGASMAVRRDYFIAIGGFPEMLDAGTATGTGGDTWAFAAVLDAGYRVIYEPRSVAYHQHRDSSQAFNKMIQANSSGAWALVWHYLSNKQFWSGMKMARTLVQWHFITIKRFRRNELPAGFLRSEIKGALYSLGNYLEATRKHRLILPVFGLSTSPLSFDAPWLRVSRKNTLKSGNQSIITVVIPTRGRKQQVCSLVDQLLGSAAVTEIIVVVDGDLDNTVDALRNKNQPERLRIIELRPESTDPEHGSGPATARNAGVNLSTGELILFLDDDVIIMDDDFVERHAAMQMVCERCVCVGPAHVDLRTASAAAQQDHRNWWVDHISRLDDPWLDWPDVCTGNLSITRELFLEIGGFDETLPRREDWDFALRSIRSGVKIIADPHAGVLQRDTKIQEIPTDAYREGFADSKIAQQHKNYGAQTISRASFKDSRRGRMMVWAYQQPVKAYRIAKLMQPLLFVLPPVSARRKLRFLLVDLCYFSGRGAAVRQLESASALSIQQSTTPVDDIEITKHLPLERIASGDFFQYTYYNEPLAVLSTRQSDCSIPTRTSLLDFIDLLVPKAASILQTKYNQYNNNTRLR